MQILYLYGTISCEYCSIDFQQLLEQLKILTDITKLIIDESFNQASDNCRYFQLIVQNLYLKMNLAKSELLLSIFDNRVYQITEEFSYTNLFTPSYNEKL